MGKLLKITIISIMISIIAALYACKSETETYTSDEGTVQIDRTGEKADITIKTKEGETYSMSVNKDELPKGWPSEIPVLPGGNIVFSQSDEKGNMQQLSIESKKSLADTLDFYKKTFDAAGWDIENTVSMPQMQILNAKKDDRELMLQIAEDGSKTLIHLLIKASS